MNQSQHHKANMNWSPTGQLEAAFAIFLCAQCRVVLSSVSKTSPKNVRLKILGPLSANAQHGFPWGLDETRVILV